MRSDDETPHVLLGKAGLAFAYVCFLISVGMIGAAIVLLPLDLKVKIFLGAAGLVLTSMFVFMAIATYLVSRPAKSSGKPPDEAR